MNTTKPTFAPASMLIGVPPGVPAATAVVHRDFSSPTTMWSEANGAVESAADAEAFAAIATKFSADYDTPQRIAA